MTESVAIEQWGGEHLADWNLSSLDDLVMCCSVRLLGAQSRTWDTHTAAVTSVLARHIERASVSFYRASGKMPAHSTEIFEGLSTNTDMCRVTWGRPAVLSYFFALFAQVESRDGNSSPPVGNLWTTPYLLPHLHYYNEIIEWQRADQLQPIEPGSYLRLLHYIYLNIIIHSVLRAV